MHRSLLIVYSLAMAHISLFVPIWAMAQPTLDKKGPCNVFMTEVRLGQLVIAIDGRAWRVKHIEMRDVIYATNHDDSSVATLLDMRGTPIPITPKDVRKIVPICGAVEDWKLHARGIITIKALSPLPEDYAIHAGTTFSVKDSVERVTAIEAVRWIRGETSVTVRVMVRTVGAKGELPARTNFIFNPRLRYIQEITNEEPLTVQP